MEYQERIKKGGVEMKWYYPPQASDRVEEPSVDTYECPVCGEELSGGHDLYFDESGEVVGCEFCIAKVTVADYLETQDYYKGGEI